MEWARSTTYIRTYHGDVPRESHYLFTNHLDRLVGQSHEARCNEHRAGVLGVKHSQQGCIIAAEVLLVVNETLGVERGVSCAEVVAHDTVSPVLLDEGRTKQGSLDDVRHLRSVAGGVRSDIERVTVWLPGR